MAMETAAAILTKLALEQNAELKSKLNAARGEANVVASIMPLFRHVLAELERDRQAHDKFPSAIPAPSAGRTGTVGLSEVEHTKDAPHHEERHERHEDDDVGGEA
jgi:hypothetical protein